MMIETKQYKTNSIRKVFIDRLNHFVNQSNQSLILSHYGEFRLHFINGLTAQFDKFLKDHNFAIPLQRKMFSILNEGMQNMLIHGKLDKEGKKIGCIYIAKNKEGFKVDFGNLINEEEQPKLVNYIDKLNQMTKDEMNELYHYTLKNGYLTNDSGSGIGLLLMRIKSNHTIDYSFTELGHQALLFNFTVQINKN
jgi:hypothetical protein